MRTTGVGFQSLSLNIGGWDVEVPFLVLGMSPMFEVKSLEKRCVSLWARVNRFIFGRMIGWVWGL